MDVGVVGLGRVGMPTAVGLAELGHCVTATDRDGSRREAMAAATPTFREPGLADALAKQSRLGRIRVSASISDMGGGLAAIFVCIGPSQESNAAVDLSGMEEVFAEIAAHAGGPLVIVDKCTVPAGTADLLQDMVRRLRPELDLTVVSSPEFLREGYALHDVRRPHRIVIGAAAAAGAAVVREIYAPLVERGCPVIETDLRTAELAKHASNAFLALKTSYANALAGLCDVLGADVVTVAEVMGMDPRIAHDGLEAGLGFGGSCLPSDLEVLAEVALRSGYPFPLLTEIERLNDAALERPVDELTRQLVTLSGRRVALLGLAFKANTDDTRRSPALRLASRLHEMGCVLSGYDPAVTELDADSPVGLVGDVYEAARDADAAVICTPWAEFRALDLHRLRSVMARPLLVDARNVVDPGAATAAGIVYVPTGRPLAPPGDVS